MSAGMRFQVVGWPSDSGSGVRVTVRTADGREPYVSWGDLEDTPEDAARSAVHRGYVVGWGEMGAVTPAPLPPGAYWARDVTVPQTDR